MTDQPGNSLALQATQCPFARRHAHEPGIIERLTRKERIEDARVAIQNAIADLWPALPPWTRVRELYDTCHLAPRSALLVSAETFRAALQAFANNGRIAIAEWRMLRDLRLSLNVGQAEAEAEESNVLRPMLDRALNEAILADVNTARSKYDHVADSLGVSAELRASVLSDCVMPILHLRLSDIMAFHSVSPDEFLRFTSFAQALGIRPDLDAETQDDLRRYAAIWRAQVGDLPVVEAGLNLRDGEVCHFAAPAGWYEHRAARAGMARFNQGVSVRVARGLYYRFGVSQPTHVEPEGLAQIDTGVAYITNRRLIFSGNIRNFSVTTESLIAFRVYDGGIALEKASGKHPHLVLRDETEFAAAILGTVLSASCTK